MAWQELRHTFQQHRALQPANADQKRSFGVTIVKAFVVVVKPLQDLDEFDPLPLAAQVLRSPAYVIHDADGVC
jgi:hypothetical protein